MFLFVEAVPARARQLETEVGRIADKFGGLPKNVKVNVIQAEFADFANELIDTMESQKKDLAPTFAFVDPFGWSGVPLELIRDLLSYDHCEVLFNFMFDSVNRFVGDRRPEIAKHFNALFGTTAGEHRAATELTGAHRRKFLEGLYARQLREVGGFTHVRSFELVDIERGRTAYYLMYGTRHIKGLQVMKDAMWSLDPVRGVRFSGFAGDQPMLFGAEPDFAPLRIAILERFAGKTVLSDEVETFVIEETDYKTSHYKKQILKVLEEEGVVVCVSDRKRRLTYPSGTTLKFSE